MIDSVRTFRPFVLARRVFSVLRRKPFDTETAAGQSEERYRRVVLSVAAAVATKAAAGISTLISVPLAVRYLGIERYGYWVAIISMVSMLVFADLGIGAALLNLLGRRRPDADPQSARTYISSAFWALGVMVLLLVVLFAFLYIRLPIDRLFGVSASFVREEGGAALLIIAGFFLLALFCGIIQRIQLSLQEGFVNSYWEALGIVLGLVLLILAILLDAGLPWIAAAVAGAPVLVTALNGFFLFGKKHPELSPRISDVSAPAAKEILKVGVLFLILQQATSLAFLSDNFIVGLLMGTRAVTEYSVPMRLFSLAPVLVNLFLLPLWPAYADALRRGDILWAQRMVSRSFLVSILITGIPSLILILFGRDLVRIWAGAEVQPSLMLLIGMGVWTVTYAAGSALVMFLTGAGFLSFQVKWTVVTAVAAIVAKVLLGRWFGLEGVVWGTTIAYLLFMLGPLVYFVVRTFRQMKLQTA